MKKVSFVIILSCLLIIVSMSVAGITSEVERFIVEDTSIPSPQTKTSNTNFHTQTLVPANAGKPYFGQPGIPVQFDGSQSSILPSSGATYIWDFGDGTTKYGAELTPTHIYQEAINEGPKVYITTLKIIKTTGEEYWDIAPVYIGLPDQDHLIPYGGCSYSSDMGEPILFDASQSINTNGGIIKYRWDFGDGSGFTQWSTTPTTTHTYNTINVYKVKLQIKDSNGNIRQDILHADIGCTYSNEESFFIGSDEIFDDVLDLLLDRDGIAFPLLCSALNANIYVNYNDDFVKTYRLGLNGYTLPLSIDVNGGTDDIIINDVKFFNIGNMEPSVFEFENIIESLQFKTTISDITISDSITKNDSITISLQFSFGPIIRYLLDLDEPFIRVGFQSEAGQDKPSMLSVNHIYKPYLYEKIINEKNVQPEHGLEITGTSDKSFSILGTISNADKTDSTTIKINYEYFTPSKAIHRQRIINNELIRDFKFEGEDESTVTISLTREKNSESSTLGMSIYPIESFNSNIGVKPTQNGGGKINFNIDNPLENLVLFAEKETLDVEKYIYFYLRNLPNSIEFEWLPKLDGFIQLQSSGEGLEIGICDDIKDPKSKLYFSKNLQETTRLDWLIDDESDDKSICLSVGVAGLTLNGFFKDLTEENQLIEFNATTQDNLDLTINWNALDKWFGLQCNDKEIDFNFSLSQPSILIDILGSLEHSGDGFTVGFDDLQNGGITFGGNTSLDLDINIEKTDDYLFSTGLLFETSGDINLLLGGSSDIGFQSSASLGLHDFFIDKQDYNLTIDEMTLNAGGGVNLAFDEDNKGISLIGSLGLDLRDIIFNPKMSGENIAILGDFSADVGADIHLYCDDESIKHLEVDGVLSIDFDDCIFKFGDNLINITGTFAMGNDVEKNNLNDLTMLSDFGFDFEDLADYGFEVEWRLPDIFKISTGSNINLTVSSFNFEPPTGWNIKQISAGSIDIGANGGIDFDIAGDQLTINTGSSLDIYDFYFEKINNDFIQIGNFYAIDSGSLELDWSDMQGVYLSSSVMLSVSDLEVNSDIVFKIIGSIEIDAEGYFYLGQGVLDAGFTGILDIDCVFELDSIQINLDGIFTLSTGSGTVVFTWASNKFTLDVTDGTTLSVSDLSFNVGEFSLEANLIEIGSSDSLFNIVWDTLNNDVNISAGSGSNLFFENIGLSYNYLVLGINGGIDLYSNGFIHIAPSALEIGISGSINLDEGVEFQLNSESVIIGGLYSISSQYGIVYFSWNAEELSLSLPNQYALSVLGLYFEKGLVVIDAVDVSLGANGVMTIFINKDIKKFEIDGSKSFRFGGFSIAINSDILCSIDNFELGGGGYLHLNDETESKINLGFNGQLGLNNLNIQPPVSWGWNIDSLQIDTLSLTGLATVGIGTLDESVLSIMGTEVIGTMSDIYMFIPLDDYEVFELILGNLFVDGNFSLVISDEISRGFEIYNDGLLSISNFACEFKKWFGSFDQINTSGDSMIEIIPSYKYCRYQSSSSSLISNLKLEYFTEISTNNIDFELGYFETLSNGEVEFDLGIASPKVTLIGDINLDLQNLNITVGDDFDFIIPALTLDGDSFIYIEFSGNYVELGYDVEPLYLDLEFETMNFGNWDIYGNFEGCANIRFFDWQPGESGEVMATIVEQISSNFQIVYNDILTVDFGMKNLTPGTIIFDWQREQEGSSPEVIYGELNILNSGVSGDLTLCKITNNDLLNPIEIQLGDITLKSGNIFTKWSKQYDQKIFDIESFVSTDINLINIIWDDEKSISLGNIALEPGEFKFTWDIVSHEVIFKNGIAGFGPIFSYKDLEKDILFSVDLLNMQNDFSKNMTLRWYVDNQERINGIYVDTDDVNFVDWITFEVIKGDTGRKISFGGLQADDFEIKKNIMDNLQISGKLYIANHLTFSKLISGEWADLDIMWDLNFDGVGYIEFQADVGFDEDMEISASLLDSEIVSTFDMPHYLRFGWDVDFDGQGNITIDTDMQEVYQISFELTKDTTVYQPKWGVYIGAVGLIAGNYNLYWDFTNPPGQWVLGSTGYLEPGSINDVEIAWNEQWYDVWWNNGAPTTH